MNNLPTELITYIFRFVSPQEATQIMHLCKSFNYAGRIRLQELLRPYLTNADRIFSLADARRALTRPLARRITDLYCILSDLEAFFRDEYWNISPIGKSRLSGSPQPSQATYQTDYMPLTIAHDSPARRYLHFTTMTPDLILNVRGERFNLGHYLTYRDSHGQAITRTEVVNALELLTAIRALIDWLRSQRGRFLTLPDGTALG